MKKSTSVMIESVNKTAEKLQTSMDAAKVQEKKKLMKKYDNQLVIVNTIADLLSQIDKKEIDLKPKSIEFINRIINKDDFQEGNKRGKIVINAGESVLQFLIAHPGMNQKKLDKYLVAQGVKIDQTTGLFVKADKADKAVTPKAK